MHSHNDGHDHGHGHGHGHSHAHAAAGFGRAFAIGVALNAGFVVAEAAGGIFAHSVALLSDAGHNFSDVLALAIAWLAAVLARRAPTARFTYGLRSSSILAALFNAALLLVAVGGLSWEALRRFGDPHSRWRAGSSWRSPASASSSTAQPRRCSLPGAATSTCAAPISIWPPTRLSRSA
jgi:cobalt-zinc-cadmium efflux system protein